MVWPWDSDPRPSAPKGDALPTELSITQRINQHSQQTYVSVHTHEDQDQVPNPSGTPFPDMDAIQVTEEGVPKMLFKMNPRKATGPDLIPAPILKNSK